MFHTKKVYQKGHKKLRSLCRSAQTPLLNWLFLKKLVKEPALFKNLLFIKMWCDKYEQLSFIIIN